MIRVNPRAHRAEDRAGDPLDGLVNLFDVGIVLAVGFLLAALASLNLTSAVTRSQSSQPSSRPGITVSPGQVASPVPTNAASATGPGREVGKVYQLPNGSLIYVAPSGASTVSAPTPAPSPSR